MWMSCSQVSLLLDLGTSKWNYKDGQHKTCCLISPPPIVQTNKKNGRGDAWLQDSRTVDTKQNYDQKFWSHLNVVSSSCCSFQTAKIYLECASTPAINWPFLVDRARELRTFHLCEWACSAESDDFGECHSAQSNPAFTQYQYSFIAAAVHGTCTVLCHGTHSG